MESPGDHRWGHRSYAPRQGRPLCPHSPSPASPTPEARPTPAPLCSLVCYLSPGRQPAGHESQRGRQRAASLHPGQDSGQPPRPHLTALSFCTTPPTGHAAPGPEHCDPGHRARVTLRALNTRVGVWPHLLFLGQLRDPATQCCFLPGQTPQVGDPPTAQPASRCTGPCRAEASAPSPMTPRVSPRILAAPEATSRICSTLWTRVPSRSAWCSHVVLRYRLRMWHMVESAVSSTDAAGTLQTAMPGDARHTGPSLGWS